jgi:hypothetical protein
MQLAMISVAAPWMACGAIAAFGLPVLAHLLSRTRYREVRFPAARFVQRAVAATSRIESPRHRLLMLLRWLVLILLVLAFMRPQWTPSAKAGSNDRGVALILMIDASASMQRTTDGASLYDRAQREARQLLDQLDPSRDVAAVVYVNHSPESLLPKTTGQLNLLIDQLETSRHGYTHPNWAGGIALTQRLVRDEARAVRIVTLSDQQGTQPDAQALALMRPDIRVDHLRIAGPTNNTSIRLVDVSPYPAIKGRSMTAVVEAENFGDTPSNVRIRCQSNAQNLQQTVTLGPNETRRITFSLQAPSGQQERLTLNLEPIDVLNADNIAGGIVPVQATSTCLIIHDPSPGSEQLADRIGLMINPGTGDNAALSTIKKIASDQVATALSKIDPAQTRTVMLINELPLSDIASQALEAYAQSGGGIVQVVADRSADQIETAASKIDFDLAPLRVFEGPSRAGLASLSWPGVSNAAIDPRAQPILVDEMQRIIVAQMPRGRGRLIAINAKLSPEPGGLLAQPAFVVLFNELCRFASPGPAMPQPARPGDPLPASLMGSGLAEIPEQADREADVYTAPGFYSGSDPGNTTYVSLDPAESDTRTASVWTNTGTAADNGAGTSAVSPIRPDVIEFWPYLLVAALALVAAESLLLWRFAGSHRTVPQGRTV